MERKCIVKRQAVDRGELLRFVLGPPIDAAENSEIPTSGGIVIPDLKEKLPGRGVWITGNRACMEEAVKKKLFSRAFKAPCNVADDLPETVETLLEKRCLNMLSLAKKAGQVITGFDKVYSAMSKTTLEVLIEAADGAEGGKKKLEKKFLAVFPNGQIINLFTSRQMDMAFGSTNVIHAAITHGNMTQNLQAAIEKLVRYRG